MSEAQQRDVSTEEAVADYVRTVLPQHRDEQSYLGGDTQEMEAILVGEMENDEPLTDDADFLALDEQTLADYEANDEQSYLGGDTQEMEAILVGEMENDEPLTDDADFLALDEQTLADYEANPMGFTAGMRFKGE